MPCAIARPTGQQAPFPFGGPLLSIKKGEASVTFIGSKNVPAGNSFSHLKSRTVTPISLFAM
jgi:hypothetical protein